MGLKAVVAFATDHKFHYYTGVALYTLIEHSSPERRYEILILADSLTSADSAIFTRLVEGRPNFSLRIIEMREKIAELGAENFYVGSYAIANYYRLFLHELLPEYDRVLYLDSDIVVQSDVGELFDTDLGNFMLGAVKDRAATLKEQLEQITYIKKTLKIRYPGKYFNSGVLLMDLDKMRNSDFSQRIRSEINSGIAFKFVDQDILNRIFGDKIYYLDATWNHMIQSRKHTKGKKIVHFPGIRPWLSEWNPLAALWWSVAEKTFFVQDLKQAVYVSSGRIEYLETIEKLYYGVLRSTSWRLTGFLRAVSNVARWCVKWGRKLCAGMIQGR